MEIDVDASAKWQCCDLWSKVKWVKGCFFFFLGYVGWKTKNYIVYNSIYTHILGLLYLVRLVKVCVSTEYWSGHPRLSKNKNKK